MKKIYYLLFFSLVFVMTSRSQVVINEVYGGGGNSGATYKNDFIELYNSGDVAVSLAGWSVQYASSAGSSWQKTNLSGTIQPHSYYLVQEVSGTGGTVSLPAPDATGTIAMSATAGKVALVSSITLLSGTCSTSTTIVDFVGFGSGTNCSETAPTASLSNTTSAQRNPIGSDTNNNSADFKVGTPTPLNSGADITPPSVQALYPANHATGIYAPLTAMIQFNEPVVTGTGTITLRLAGGTVVTTLDIATLTPSGSSLLITIPFLETFRDYYFEITPGALKDGSGNPFAGITGSGTWSFSTSPAHATLNTTYSFDVCSVGFPDGFYQYSVTGEQKWGCVSFGYDNSGSSGNAPNGIQMNGYAGGTNIPNEDWFITPAYDLTSTQYPLFSFMSRTAFEGAPLQLKISTDYSGFGDPYAATWTDLDGKFPAKLTDKWKASTEINMESFKEPNVHLAFVYTSTAEDGARWTLDNIRLDNSATPPAPDLAVNPSSLTFPYIAKGESGTKPFGLTAANLTGGLTLTVQGPFALSKNGSQFSASISYSLEEANNHSLTVWVRFSPGTDRQTFDEIITIDTPDASAAVEVTGSSISPETTLDVINWNLEWFGSPSLGPVDDNLQQQNVREVLKNYQADLYGLVEVVNESRLQSVVSQMSGYSYVICNYGSHTNPNDLHPGPLSEAQKLAFIYRTDIFSNVSTTALLSKGIDTAEDITNPDYDFWSSGRFPFMLTADVTLNCRTEKVRFVLVHAKANTSPTTTSYDRRTQGARDLHTYLNETYPGDKVIILGDFNDDLDKTITTGLPGNITTSSWSSFTDDAANYLPVTLPLSLDGRKSTASYNDVIDHVIITNDLTPFYVSSSAAILTEVTYLFTNYAKTTTDHFPVLTRYLMPNNVAPVAEVTPVFSFCQSAGDMYTIPALSAEDDCESPLTYSYFISGSTSRSGQGNDASGFFDPGTSTITWTVSDDWGNAAQFVSAVEVHRNPVVSVPDAFALNLGVDPNTVYPGYLPASSITLRAETDDDGSYVYEWSDGTGIIGNSPGITVSPTMATTYTVSVTNVYGCTTIVDITVSVVHVEGGNKGNKVMICHFTKPQSLSLIIDPKDVKDHLEHGDHLGSCQTAGREEEIMKSAEVTPGVGESFMATLFPNPSAGYFHLTFNGGKSDDPISIRVINMLGVTMDHFSGLKSSSVLSFGGNYDPGIYLVEVKQGTNCSVHKIIRQ